jgi:hypothetical protein
MQDLRRSKAMLWGLWANAAMLGLLACILIGRDSRTGSWPAMLPAAYAQNQPAIAGGAGVFIMPGQVSDHTWGCFLLDVDSQTLCAYQFKGGKSLLELIAARSYKFDRRLAEYNTVPKPRDIEQILQEEQKAIRGAAPGR